MSFLYSYHTVIDYVVVDLPLYHDDIRYEFFQIIFRKFKEIAWNKANPCCVALPWRGYPHVPLVMLSTDNKHNWLQLKINFDDLNVAYVDIMQLAVYNNL